MFEALGRIGQSGQDVGVLEMGSRGDSHSSVGVAISKAPAAAEKLVGNSATPLFQQLADTIAAEIDSGSYRPGDMIPSERELSERYSISRVTVRRAIVDLVDRGVLVKRQGKGTFVNTGHLERQITQTAELLTFVEMCRNAGKMPGTHVLGVDRVKADAQDACFLGLPEGCELLRVRRIRTADHVPVMFECSLFPVEGFEFLSEEVMRQPSILSLVEDKAGRKVGGHAQCSLRIVKATSEMGRYLSVPTGEPLFLETVNFIDEDGLPLFVAKDYVVGSLMVFDF